MDSDAEIQKAQDELDYVLGWIDHPLTKEFRKDLQEGIKDFTSKVCGMPITNMASFFAHFEMTGHLHGFTAIDQMIDLRVQEQRQKLKEAQENGN